LKLVIMFFKILKIKAYRVAWPPLVIFIHHRL
jgi:hypothetical protein